MATTYLDLLSDSLTAIGQLGTGQSISPEQAAQGLRAGNRMLGKWTTQRLLIFNVATRTYALVVGTQDYTVGPTGTLGGVTTRPVLVESARMVMPGSLTELGMSILDKNEWDAIQDKGSVCGPNGVPSKVWPEYSMPNLGLHVSPIPSNGATIKIGTWDRLQEFISVFDVLNFPPGYEEGIMWNLAMELCPFYDMPTDGVAPMAADGILKIQAANAQSLGGAFSPDQTLQSPNVGQPQPAGG